MLEQIIFFLRAMLDQTGAAHFWWGNAVMMVIGATMIYLAIAKHYEPFLLVGIGFACIVANVPGSDLILPGGLFYYAYQGVALLIIPPLIFLGVGAMTDFGPMIANPKLVILGAGAHLGIFVALSALRWSASASTNPARSASSAARTAPWRSSSPMKLAPHLLPQISVAAYSYMALMPLIQPPVMRLLTTHDERANLDGAVS